MKRVPVFLLFPLAAFLLTGADVYTTLKHRRDLGQIGESAQASFNELLEIAKTDETVKLRLNAVGTYAHREVDGTIEIGFSNYTWRSHSDLAIKGLLAHEFGHILAGHTDTEQPQDAHRQAYRQAQATAIGICLAGPEATAAWVYEWSKTDKQAADEHLALASMIYANHVTADCRLK